MLDDMTVAFPGTGPAISMEAGTVRALPALSGPGVSADSGGRRAPTLKLRGSFLTHVPSAAGAAASLGKGHNRNIPLECRPMGGKSGS
jgi:hypothetical protein